jgi:hypothetical protein
MRFVNFGHLDIFSKARVPTLLQSEMFSALKETKYPAILSIILLPTQSPQEANDRDESLVHDFATSIILLGHNFLHPDSPNDSKLLISDKESKDTLLIWKHPKKLIFLKVFEHGDFPND